MKPTLNTIVALCVACILTTASIAFYALALGTDNWIEVTVPESLRNEPKLNAMFETEAIYHSYNRGILRVCFKGQAEFLNQVAYEALVKDGACIFDRTISSPFVSTAFDAFNQLSPNAVNRSHLIRAHLAMESLGLIFAFIAALFCIGLCWKVNKRTALGAMIISLIALISGGSAMGCFHGYEYYENNVIDDAMLFPIRANFEWRSKPEHSKLMIASTSAYGYSYILGWVAMASSFFATIFFAITYATIPGYKKRKYKHGSNKSDKYVDEWMGETNDPSAYNYKHDIYSPSYPPYNNASPYPYADYGYQY